MTAAPELCPLIVQMNFFLDDLYLFPHWKVSTVVHFIKKKNLLGCFQISFKHLSPASYCVFLYATLNLYTGKCILMSARKKEDEFL